MARQKIFVIMNFASTNPNPTHRLVRAHVNIVFDNCSRLLVPTAGRNDISRVVGFFDPVVSDE